MLNGCGALLGACVTGILSISFGFGAGLLAGAALRAPRSALPAADEHGYRSPSTDA